eukprot:NODE_4563_length_770_cov_10.465008_g4404_i0.p1 GENE.NODE_4563_length_770_cov_10.465008_g4404_i0~~NODE_4563_length_770_cov_10.465008_g4404_i0.p1  ORF type:complete len:224 (+),score=10.11 NODE_4563_length_770_cov_10.465008_g4404_i0:71-742(+)
MMVLILSLILTCSCTTIAFVAFLDQRSSSFQGAYWLGRTLNHATSGTHSFSCTSPPFAPVLRPPLPSSPIWCSWHLPPSAWHSLSLKGVLVFPAPSLATTLDQWLRYCVQLMRRPVWAPRHLWRAVDQIAYSATITALHLPFKELPLSLNFPLPLINRLPPNSSAWHALAPPVLLHHHRVGIAPNGLPNLNWLAQQVAPPAVMAAVSHFNSQFLDRPTPADMC